MECGVKSWPHPECLIALRGWQSWFGVWSEFTEAEPEAQSTQRPVDLLCLTITCHVLHTSRCVEQSTNQGSCHKSPDGSHVRNHMAACHMHWYVHSFPDAFPMCLAFAVFHLFTLSFFPESFPFIFLFFTCSVCNWCFRFFPCILSIFHVFVASTPDIRRISQYGPPQRSLQHSHSWRLSHSQPDRPGLAWKTTTDEL